MAFLSSTVPHATFATCSPSAAMTPFTYICGHAGAVHAACDAAGITANAAVTSSGARTIETFLFIVRYPFLWSEYLRNLIARVRWPWWLRGASSERPGPLVLVVVAGAPSLSKWPLGRSRIPRFAARTAHSHRLDPARHRASTSTQARDVRLARSSETCLMLVSCLLPSLTMTSNTPLSGGANLSTPPATREQRTRSARSARRAVLPALLEAQLHAVDPPVRRSARSLQSSAQGEELTLDLWPLRAAGILAPRREG